MNLAHTEARPFDLLVVATHLARNFHFDSFPRVEIIGVPKIGRHKFSMAKVTVGRNASWGTDSKNLTLGRTIFSNFVSSIFSDYQPVIKIYENIKKSSCEKSIIY